jgi:hypothetical protein
MEAISKPARAGSRLPSYLLGRLSRGHKNLPHQLSLSVCQQGESLRRTCDKRPSHVAVFFCLKYVSYNEHLENKKEQMEEKDYKFTTEK